MRGAVRWVACVALMLCDCSYAQSVEMSLDATKIGTPINLSATTWQFTLGDDPRYADPAFDDSQWKTFLPGKSFQTQRYAVPSGMWWHRLHVQLASGTKDLAMTITGGSYQVYVNGKLIGQQGGFPGRPESTVTTEQVYPIPLEAVRDESAVIAVREWLAPIRAQSDYALDGHMLLGDQKLLGENRTVWDDSQFCGSFGDIAEGVIAFMVGIWALALFRAQPDNREYLWLGVMGLLQAIVGSFALYKTVFHLSVMNTFWGYTVPLTVVNIVFFLFVCAFLRVRVNGWVKAYCYGQLWWPISFIAVMQGWIPIRDFFAVGLLLNSAADVVGPLLAIRQYRRGDREAGALLLSLVVVAASDYGSLAQSLLNLRKGVHGSGIPNLILGPASLSPESISEILFYLTIGGIMLRRSMAISRQQQRTAAELEAGRSVQTFLLGRDASAPGYTVESAYLPAQEVGGDFFQTIAGADGSLLAVIGDVAGKGLQAAMRVSMLIGAVRLSPNERPAALLAKLNEVLLQDGSSGFTTCLAARLNSNGTTTIANAGHLSPYLNGRELEIDGGLPLGVVPGIDYAEQTFPFVAGDLMLLLSDGVVEARNPSGDLFGFERMMEAAGGVNNADALAETAKAFGQDDDITVLLLRRSVATL